MTITWEDALSTITARAKTQLADVYGVYIQYPNAEFTLSDTNDLPGGCWLKLDILGGGSEPMACGTRRQRSIGIIMFSVYTQLDEGEKAAVVMADNIRGAFNSNDGGVVFRTPSIEKGYRDGDYWRKDVNIPFHADNIE